MFQLIRQDASSAIPYPKPAIDAGVEINDRMKGGTEVSESEHMRCGGDRWNIRDRIAKGIAWPAEFIQRKAHVLADLCMAYRDN